MEHEFKILQQKVENLEQEKSVLKKETRLFIISIFLKIISNLLFEKETLVLKLHKQEQFGISERYFYNKSFSKRNKENP